MKVYGQLEVAQLENLAADPTGVPGRKYFNTVSKLERVYDGTSWNNTASGASITSTISTDLFTPDPTAFGTVTNLDCRTRKVGDRYQAEIFFTCGTTTGSPAFILLPAGITLDSTKVVSGTRIAMLGTYISILAAGGLTAVVYYIMYFDGTNTDRLFFGSRVGSGAINAETGSSSFSTGDSARIIVDFPFV